MSNRDVESAWSYHNTTKHSFWSIRTDSHSLDWANKPLLFKLYPTLEPLLLPRDFTQTGSAALLAIAQTETQTERDVVPDLSRLGALLYFSAGITKRRTYPGGEIYYRAAACTGALYEIEMYLVCGDVPGLPAGVYHFGPGDFALRKLRSGDFRAILVRATGAESAVSHAPLTVICTGTVRGARAAGTGGARFRGCRGEPVVKSGLHGGKWRFLSSRLGHTAKLPPEPPTETEPLKLDTVSLSKTEVDYAAMRAMHETSSLRSGAEVAEWRRQTPIRELPVIRGACTTLKSYEDEANSLDQLEEVILRRGSTRTFSRASINFPQLSTMLDFATRGIPLISLIHLGHLSTTCT